MRISEKAMAPHFSTLAWKIPRMEESSGLQSMGSLRVGHDWATSLSLFIFMHWRSKWQPTPVFLPGDSPGQGSLVGYRLWGRTESDTTEATWQQQQQWEYIISILYNFIHYILIFLYSCAFYIFSTENQLFLYKIKYTLCWMYPNDRRTQ